MRALRRDGLTEAVECDAAEPTVGGEGGIPARDRGRKREAKFDVGQRDQAVADLIGLVGAVDGICQMQAKADAEYFAAVAVRAFEPSQLHAQQGECIQAALAPIVAPVQ